MQLMAVGLADNRSEAANSPYLTKVGDAMHRNRPDQILIGRRAPRIVTSAFSPYPGEPRSS